MLHPALDRRDGLASVALVPEPVEVFGRDPELHDEIARKVFRLGFAALLPPEAEQGSFVGPHDDSRVRPADETSPSCNSLWKLG